jgi:hypothetical protein
MILDNYLVVSGTVPATGVITGQAALPVAGTPVVSTDTIDLVNTRDIGEGQDLYMVFTIVAAYNTLTTLTIEVIGATNAALSSGVTVLGSTGAIALASLTANATFMVRINPALYSTGTRYIGARYTNGAGGSTPTTGSVCAYLVQDIQDGRKFYASGFTVQ